MSFHSRSALPSLLTTATNFAIFSTIYVVAHQWHGVKQIQSALGGNKKKTEDDARKKLIVISGCDRGFGRLLAENLYKSTDYIVLALVLTDEGLEELNAVANDDPSSSTKRLFVLKCNVTSDTDIQKAKASVSEILGAQNAVLYSIVNNAGIADPGDFLFFHNLDTYQKIMDVNFFGQLRLTQALLPSMLRTSKSIAGGARILNLSSVCGASATPSNSAYNASKFAVEAWSDSLRLEMEPFNVKIVKIRPGQISTTIQTDFTTNIVKNYKAAPVQIRELYGGDAYLAKMNETYNESMGNLASKPSLVIDTLTELLGVHGSKLKPYYWIGNDAHTLWKAFHSLPTTVADSMKRLIQIHPIQPDIPPVDVISHVAIAVKNIDKSVPFYQAFGFEVVGEKKNGYQFLRSRPSKTGWPTHILLKEDKGMPARGNAGSVGMTRLCMYASNIKAEVRRIEKTIGLKPMAPQAHSKSGVTVAAFQDPDGFVVYIIRMPVVVDIIVRCMKWWKKTKTPSMFHWTVNVSDIKTGMAVFEKLGFVKMFDGSGDQVLYDLVPAFGMKEEGCFIEAYRLCKLPNDAFVATVMGWVTPKSEVKADALLNTLTISVRDVETALSKAREAGMETEPAKYVDLPVFGRVHVGTAYAEAGANRIEFCCFTNKLEL